jgi:isoleucyl-tRNA synthetase
LDVLKDRLYTSPPKSKARRSAQSALEIILDTLTRVAAPILAFMAEEVWAYMPNRHNRPASVHLAQLPEVNESFMDTKLAERWEPILALRAEVSKAVEEARARKMIGHSLDAAVTLGLPEGFLETVKPTVEELRTVLIVSKVSILSGTAPEGAYKSTAIDGLTIGIDRAPGEKCERCWIYDLSVGTDDTHKTICSRCVEALKAAGSVT